jgi:transposase
VKAGTFPAEASSRAQYGPRLRALAVYLVEQQLVPYGRVREMLSDLFGVQLSVGTLVEWVQQAAAVLEPVEARIKAALSQAPVLHSDETGVRQAGHLAWIHVASTQRLTHYGVHPKARYRGDQRHRHLADLPRCQCARRLEALSHAYELPACGFSNIHHVRELTFLEQQYDQPWAKDLERTAPADESGSRPGPD